MPIKPVLRVNLISGWSETSKETHEVMDMLATIEVTGAGIDHKELHKYIEAIPYFLEIAEDFIKNVELGRIKSVVTYQNMKAAIAITKDGIPK